MAYNEELALRVRVALGEHDGVAEKKMFGGIAFMLSGNMCCGVTGGDLMVRVGPDGLDGALAQPHTRPMDFTGRPMKGFVYVGPEGTEKEDSLIEFINKEIDYWKNSGHDPSIISGAIMGLKDIKIKIKSKI